MTALKGVGSKFAAKYKELIGENCGIEEKFLLPPGNDGPQASSGSGADGPKKAVLAQFDAKGKLIQEAQPEERHEREFDNIDWKQWQTDKEIADRINQARARSNAYCAWATVWLTAPEVKHIEVVRKCEQDGGKMERWQVRALEDFKPQTLLIAPYIAGPEKVLEKLSMHPDAAVVTVQSGVDRLRTFSFAPDFSNKSEEEVAELMAETAYITNSRSLFWACRRSSKEQEWNCEYVDMKNSVTACTQWNSVSALGLDPSAAATVVTVQVIVNTRKIPKGEEVVVKCAPPAPAKPKPKRGDRTWEDDAKIVIQKTKAAKTTKK